MGLFLSMLYSLTCFAGWGEDGLRLGTVVTVGEAGFGLFEAEAGLFEADLFEAGLACRPGLLLFLVREENKRKNLVTHHQQQQ